MAEPIVYKDENGSVEPIRAGFYIRQPSSSSDAERENAALHACEAEGRRKIAEWNTGPFPMKLEFYAVRLVGMEGVTSKTKKNPVTGVRHHECKGTGVAHLLYTIRGGGMSPMALTEANNGFRSKAAGLADDQWSEPQSWLVSSEE